MNSKEAFQQLAAEAQRGELVFSTHAQVALQVRLALDDPDLHMDAAARVVQAEPLLAARVVSVANSVVFNRSGQAVTDVRNAVSRLGIKHIRTLSTALLVRQMAGATSHQDVAKALWEHTAHVAALAYVLARRVSRQNPDVALFAGLVHEVGGFYLISRADAHPGLLTEAGVDGAWFDGGEACLGEAVLAALALPDPVAAAVRALWQGESTLSPATVADTLRLAHDLTPIASPLQATAQASRREELLARTDLAPQTLAEVLEESADELASLTAALRF